MALQKQGETIRETKSRRRTLESQDHELQGSIERILLEGNQRGMPLDQRHQIKRGN